MRRSGAKSLLVVLAALVPTRAGAEAMRFAWPVPAKVEVRERAVKHGSDVLMSYQVSVAPAPDGQRLSVRLSGFQFLEIDGLDARQPAIRKKLGPMLKEVGKDLPTLIVDREGAFQEMAGMDKLIAKLSASLPPDKRAATRKMMRAPQFMAMLEESSAQFWNIWVGMWIGAEVPTGRPVQRQQALELPDGSTVPRLITITNHGPAGPPGYVRLGFESTLEGDLRKLVGLVTDVLPQVTAAGQPMAPDQRHTVSVSLSGDVVTDPATLRPASARWEKRSTIHLSGQRPHTAKEFHDYTFTWQKPAGPRR